MDIALAHGSTREHLFLTLVNEKCHRDPRLMDASNERFGYFVEGFLGTAMSQ
jgi:hypothetical protein